MVSLSTPQPVKPQRELRPEDLEGDLIQPGNSLFGIIWINPDRLSGTPCFAGTRVPVKNLFDYLQGNEPLSEFLKDFPGVTQAQAEAVISLADQTLTHKLIHS